MSIQPCSFDRANIYEKIKKYVIPPITAGISIIPVFFLFVYKSAKQEGKPLPKMPLVKWVREGVKAAPTLGFIIGSQVIIQEIVERILFKQQEHRSRGFLEMFASSLIVGTLSAPGLVAFNAQTMGKPIIPSIKNLSLRQIFAIMGREAGFLFSIRVSDPIGEIVRERLGNNPVAIYTAVFLSGVIGSICSHPADTYLTALQAKFRVKTIKDYTKGSYYRAAGVGGYVLCLKIIKDSLEKRIG